MDTNTKTAFVRGGPSIFKTGGFTLLEIVIAVAVGGLIVMGGLISLAGIKKEKELDVAAGNIVSALETAKANALAGRGGVDHGVAFATSSYTVFVGDAYDPDDIENRTFPVAPSLDVSTTFASPADVIVFSRLTGAASEAGNITIERVDNASSTRVITVESMGNISVE